MRFKRVVLLTALTALAAVPLSAAPECPKGPGVHYISHNPQVCAVIRFFCEEGQVAFSNECGCGCIDIEALPDALAASQTPEVLDSLPLPWIEKETVSLACESGSGGIDAARAG